MKRFSRGWEKNDGHPREKVINQTTQEVANIIKSENYQWENFNKVVGYIESIIVWVLENDVKLLNLQQVHHANQLSLALAFPFFISSEGLEKEDPEIIEMYNKNLVTRVSMDSLRKNVILKALDGILKISSEEEFWDKNYKIWNIEINSFEDLEQHRVELQKMREDFESYEIPGYKEAVQYAAENGINTNFYS